ncbi:hypothetical protein K469DRAFT_721071 [Zopfia rhizophila CBS 207.26]|uniref:Uncharacterized protein n=1 Tax=Zopfia rhizophila CBS 207.26 TaxID=1314779 RepID=A0A6A6DDB0_9PEZI|nr:hypothetical protein K469DRAFT_721071 [Zopfia rhizophila CBS 207.26]
MSSPQKSSSLINTTISFFALYLTTLFSMDTWAAARGSPYRAPTSNAYYRPANPIPSPDSYQGGMTGPNHWSGGGNSGNDAGRRDIGRVPNARDSRPPMRLIGTAACGACMS